MSGPTYQLALPCLSLAPIRSVLPAMCQVRASAYGQRRRHVSLRALCPAHQVCQRRIHLDRCVSKLRWVNGQGQIRRSIDGAREPVREAAETRDRLQGGEVDFTLPATATTWSKAYCVAAWLCRLSADRPERRAIELRYNASNLTSSDCQGWNLDLRANVVTRESAAGEVAAPGPGGRGAISSSQPGRTRHRV